jgi:hypothetical protein
MKILLMHYRKINDLFIKRLNQAVEKNVTNSKFSISQCYWFTIIFVMN